jgi:pimeloyl-ACP methyl ester carboxylesterase
MEKRLSETEIEALPSSPGPIRTWMGVNMLTGGKGYAPTPLGQVHYRDIGPRDTRATMLLFHQSPLSMVEFGAVQNSLAKLGIRSIATDTPGYGLSDQPDIIPTVGGFADNFVYVLDHLGIDKVVAGGHHTGASIATSLATRHPDRVSGVVLHGCPIYTLEEVTKRKAQPEWDRAPKQDGSHLSQLFRRARERTENEMFAWTWMSVTMFLQGPDIGHWAVHRYDMTTDLKNLKQPALIITEGEDVIHHMDVRAHELRPDFAYRVLAEKSFTGVMTDPDGWAKLAAEFIDSSVK